MMSYIGSLLTPGVSRSKQTSSSTPFSAAPSANFSKKSSSPAKSATVSCSDEKTGTDFVSNSMDSPNLSPIVSDSNDSSTTTSSNSSSTAPVPISTDAIFLHLLERISNVEAANSKLRLENDFLEERLVSLAESQKQHEIQFSSLKKEISSQNSKFQENIDNLDHLVSFHAKESMVLLGTVKQEIIETVCATDFVKVAGVEQKTLDTAGSKNNSTTDSISNTALHDEFASLSNDNAVLNTKIDNLHDENIFLNDKLDLLVNRVRDLTTDGHDLQKEFDELKLMEPQIDPTIGADIHILKQKVYDVEKELYKTNQYNRRQNLVIDGIPDKIPQRDLERLSVDIINKLGFPVQFRDVVGCHRLKKPTDDPNKPTPTIIRFTNRKVTEYCMRNNRFLGRIRVPWKLSFREDLCDANDDIWNQCLSLKEDGVINHFLVRNGFVKVVEKRGDFPRKINHPDDLLKMFPHAFV